MRTRSAETVPVGAANGTEFVMTKRRDFRGISELRLPIHSAAYDNGTSKVLVTVQDAPKVLAANEIAVAPREALQVGIAGTVRYPGDVFLLGVRVFSKK